MGRALKVLTLKEADQWDRIVKSFQEHDVYYLSGYVKAFEIHGDGQPLLFYYEEKGLRGIHVAMKRDIGEDVLFRDQLEPGKYFDLSTPYGYGGWLVEDDQEKGKDHLFEEYWKWCKRNQIVSEFVRFHPMIGNHRYCEKVYEVIGLGETVAMDLTESEGIWTNMSSKNRGHIRKAMKNNVKIYHGRFPEIFDVFQDLYNSTMEKDGAEDYYYFSNNFYTSVLEDLPENAQVFYGQLTDKTVIAAAIILSENGRLNYHLSGSIRQYSSLAATNLLLYKAALWGNANGYKTLYLGGGVGSGEDSLFQFKRAFYKGELRRFYIGKKIWDIDNYKKLTELRNIEMEKLSENKEKRLNYFPEYRA